ncbi:MAG: 16S rRNA (cytidine(1402)-2'-O)-methyltransferase [Candidatus Omnitrophota bacterium]|nr:MAG: 16S rRNA (cytidine(1402)-2'-O)-methyltransferase [Candidatus Omnitrophota bacterium]
MENTGLLYIVSTPIGNLKDITLRALEILSLVDIIACEDTRRTAILLGHYQIKKPLLSYFAYNKKKRLDPILQMLSQGRKIALVSDAGTPCISDPGSVLVREAIEHGIDVEVIPGVSAFAAALVVSGLRTDKFIFQGFLPIKSGAKIKLLQELKPQKRTLIFYESCHRLVKTLEVIKFVFGCRKIAIARELTKKFAEIRRETAEDALNHFNKVKPKGEFVIVI